MWKKLVSWPYPLVTSTACEVISNQSVFDHEQTMIIKKSQTCSQKFSNSKLNAKRLLPICVESHVWMQNWESVSPNHAFSTKERTISKNALVVRTMNECVKHCMFTVDSCKIISNYGCIIWSYYKDAELIDALHLFLGCQILTVFWLFLTILVFWGLIWDSFVITSTW